MKKRIILFLISLSLLALLIYFSDVTKILETLSRANPFFLFMGMLFWVLDTFLRTFRWRILLRRIGVKISFFRLWQIFIASMFVSNLSPAKTGDPIRSVILKRNEGKSFSRSLSSIVVERIMDVAFLVSVSLISVLFFFPKVQGIGKWLYVAVIIYTFGVCLAIFIISSENRAELFFTKLFRIFSFIPKVRSYEPRVKRGSKKLHRAFKTYKSLPTLFSAFALTCVIWSIQGAVLYLCFKSIGLEANPLACVVAIAFSVLIGVLTFLPGALGSSEVVTVAFFTSLFSLSLPQVTTATLLLRFLFFWPYVVLGSLIFSLKFK